LDFKTPRQLGTQLKKINPQASPVQALGPVLRTNTEQDIRNSQTANLSHVMNVLPLERFDFANNFVSTVLLVVQATALTNVLLFWGVMKLHRSHLCKLELCQVNLMMDASVAD